jgi:hypothetical protein
MFPLTERAANARLFSGNAAALHGKHASHLDIDPAPFLSFAANFFLKGWQDGQQSRWKALKDPSTATFTARAGRQRTMRRRASKRERSPDVPR